MSGIIACINLVFIYSYETLPRTSTEYYRITGEQSTLGGETKNCSLMCMNSQKYETFGEVLS